MTNYKKNTFYIIGDCKNCQPCNEVDCLIDTLIDEESDKELSKINIDYKSKEDYLSFMNYSENIKIPEVWFEDKLIGGRDATFDFVINF